MAGRVAVWEKGGRWTKWGLGWRKRAVGARKIGADGGFRGGDCHAENGVLMVAIATILGKNFFLPRAQKFPREHDKRDK